MARGILDNLLGRPAIYRLWQSPFAHPKIRPLLPHVRAGGFSSLLDIGCGPGTNVPYLPSEGYLGLDVEERYVAYARERFGVDCIVADAREWSPEPPRKFDFVLINSILHHIDDAGVDQVLAHAAAAMSERSTIHILDLVRPESASIASVLAALDRGPFARKTSEWREFFARHFDIEEFRPHDLGIRGMPLWHMVYCRARIPR